MNLDHKKILIVEDRYQIYQSLVEFFENKGLSVIKNTNPNHAVDTYENAIQLADTYRPDIAIVDIQLIGEKTGLDVCEYLRKNYPTFLIILTDKVDVDLKKARAFADGYILKVPKTKPTDQLWIALQMNYPFPEDVLDKNAGYVFNVRQNLESRDFSKQFFLWDKISRIESLNAKAGGKGNNNLQLFKTAPDKTFVFRGTLSALMQILPGQFIRINKYQILNKDHITKFVGKTEYYIGDQLFKQGLRYSLKDMFIPH